MDPPGSRDGPDNTDRILSATHSPVGLVLWRPEALAFKAFVRPPHAPQLEQGQLRGKEESVRAERARPLVVKLTKDIVDTFGTCNPTFRFSDAFNPKRYLTNPSDSASNDGLDNENFDLILAVNGVLINTASNHRFIVKDILGQGTFGQVVKCWAEERKCFVAVKVIKNQPAYYQQALVEISILNLLNHKFDPGDKHHIVRILDHFVYQEHLCIVFEMLGVNLYELLKVNLLRGISLNLVRLFTKHILTALMILHDAGVIHCDLKPENILLTTSLQSAEIKLIDFGSACMETRTVYSYIQSRFYRSPEVLLGHPYTSSIDMWSFGCVVAELFLGLPLFPGASQYDLLQRMINVLGMQPPDHILRNSRKTKKYFKHVGSYMRQEESRPAGGQNAAYQFLTLAEYESRERERPTIEKRYFDGNLEEMIATYPFKKAMSQKEIEKEKLLRLIFTDFLRGLLRFDPLKRWTPKQAAEHPFVTEKPFSGPYTPLPETPRAPICQGITVEHNPVSGHWFASGLSPQVVSMNANLQYGSPQYQGASFSYASSYGSVGSNGSLGEGGSGLGSSFGSFGDASALYMSYRIPSAMGNAGFGVSPETRQRMGQVPPSALGHAHLGLSPSSSFFRPMSLGASPSQFTPPSPQFQASPGSPSTGSPGRYGPSSPARGGGGASVLGKAAAVGQYNKRRGWGSPGSTINTASGGYGAAQETIAASWHGIYQNPISGNGDISPGSYLEGGIRNTYLSSPGNTSVQGAQGTHSSHWRHPNGMAVGTTSVPTQNLKPFITYPSGTLGAMLSTSETADDGVEEMSSPPDPGDWDPNYSEEQLLQEDGVEMASPTAAGVSPSGTIESGVHVGSGRGKYTGTGSGTNSSAKLNYLYLQGVPNNALRPNSMIQGFMDASPSLQGYGWIISKPLHPGPYLPQQNSHSRLGQPPSQYLHHQLQYQNCSPYHQSPDQQMYSSPISHHQLNHYYHMQNIQSPDQPVQLDTSGQSHMSNGDVAGNPGSGILASPHKDRRTEYSQGAVVLNNGANTGPTCVGSLGNYQILGAGLSNVSKQDHLNHIPGRRVGPSIGSLPPTAPSRKDRRMGP